MQIPPDIIPLYRAEANSASTTDNKRAEPVGELAELGNALSESAGERHAQPDQKHSGWKIGKQELRTKPRKHYSAEERRKNDRRKENLPVLIDTRLSRSRREAEQNAKINLTA